MRLLLDTHIFLWYISTHPQPPIAFRDAIREPSQTQQEGVSFNQYVVYTLARVVTAADLAGQRHTFEALKSRFAPEQAEQPDASNETESRPPGEILLSAWNPFRAVPANPFRSLFDSLCPLGGFRFIEGRGRRKVSR